MVSLKVPSGIALFIKEYPSGGAVDESSRRPTMALTNRLANPTPFPVKLKYDRGIFLKVPPFGSVELTMQQLDDFRDGKPGSEAVQQTTNFHGLFLMDSDRPYDHQALEAIERSIAAKEEQYRSSTQSLIDTRASAGVNPDKVALEETFRRLGLTDLKEEVESLKNQARLYRKTVESQPESRKAQQLDPNRTVFVMDPPTEFPSVAAKDFFLSLPENAEIAEKHKAFEAGQGG